jgi:ribonuclease VapC
VILDASALLALLLEEAGQEAVIEALTLGAGASAANIAEAAAVLVRGGMPDEEVRASMIRLPLTIFDVDIGLALQAACLFRETRRFGLSLGDRLCLAVGLRESRPVLTADRTWTSVGAIIGADIRLIR